jgi:hypothetical protein
VRLPCFFSGKWIEDWPFERKFNFSAGHDPVVPLLGPSHEGCDRVRQYVFNLGRLNLAGAEINIFQLCAANCGG